MGAFSIGFTVTLLVRTTRGRPSKSFVCAAEFAAKPSAKQATNKRGNSLQTITGFLRSPYSIFVLLAQREVRAQPFYPPAPVGDNSQCDRFEEWRGPDSGKTICLTKIKRRFQALPKKLFGLNRAPSGWERGRPRPHTVLNTISSVYRNTVRALRSVRARAPAFPALAGLIHSKIHFLGKLRF